MTYSATTLIRKAIEENAVHYLNAIPKILFTEVEQAYIDWINKYLVDHNVMPTLDNFDHNHRNARIDSTFPNEPITDVFQQVSQRLSDEYVQRHINDPHLGISNRQHLEKLLRDSKITDINIIDYTTFDRNTYDQQIKVIPFNIPWFDNTFDGLFPGEVGFLFGRMKSMKTTILQLMMISLLKNGTKILSISQEISNIKFSGKLDAFQTNMNPKIFRRANFSDEQKSKLKELQSNLRDKEKTKGKLILGGKVSNLNDLKALYYNASERPEVIFIDAVELIASFSANREHHQSLSEVAYGLQGMALDLKVPIVGTLQANRSAKGGDLDTTMVAGSDTFARACEWLLGISRIEENEDIILKLQTIAYRDGELVSTYVKPDFNTMQFKFMKLTEAEKESFTASEAAIEVEQQLSEVQQIKELEGIEPHSLRQSME